MEEWIKAVAGWASKNDKINKVYFIGSRVRADKVVRADSDLDIAIQLNENFGYTDWFYESEQWSSELDAIVEPSVHLLRGGGKLHNAKVESAIVDHGLLIYSRENT